MTDEEFLSYCTAHVLTERAGFIPEQLDRLFKLSGRADGGNWLDAPKHHIESFANHRHLINDRVDMARVRLAEEARNGKAT